MATATNSPSVANAATQGGAIHNQGTLHVANSLLVQSTGSDDCQTANPGAVVTYHHNVVSSGNCGPTTPTDPLLTALADNGGPTQTHALSAGSPVIDAGDDATCATLPVGGLDQRGAQRPQGAHRDIGAYEFGAPLGPPVAKTGEVSALAGTIATVLGLVNPGNATTTVRFEYGPDAAYGFSAWASPQTAAGASDTPVSAGLTGLAPETTYHYCVVAENSAGVSRGEGRTFTTAGPPTATTLPATGVSAGGAIMNGLVDGHGLSADVWFEYGLNLAYPYAAAAEPSPVDGLSPATVSAPLVGLLPATTYHYRVAAESDGGIALGEDLTFTTPPAAPWVETGPADHVSAGGATLQGTVNARGASTAVRFEYGRTISYVASVAAEPGPVEGTLDVTVSAPVAGLAPGTTYHYCVVAENTAGTTYGADRTFTTDALPGVFVPLVWR